jgi:hypothetical protein
MTFILFIFVTVLLYVLFSGKVRKLNERVSHMEKYLQETTKQLATQQKEVELQEPDLSTVQSSSSPITGLEEQYTSPAVFEQNVGEVSGGFLEWLKTDWLMKLGGLLIVLGMAWFVNYAFVHDWIGDIGKIGLGLVVGTLIVALGRYRIQAYASQGSILMFVGVLGIILTLWAGREYYGFFTPLSVLVMMFLASSLLGVTSVTQNRVSLAYANVLLGAVAPLLTGGVNMTISVLFTYLFILAIGSVWVAVVTGWRQIILTSLAVIYLHSIPFLGGYIGAEEETGLLFCFAFTALYFLVTIGGLGRSSAVKVYDLITAVVSGVFLITWILTVAAPEWQVLLLTAWTLVFGFGAFTAVRLGAGIEFFYGYGGVGAVLLATATAIELEGPELTIAFIFEALVVLLVGYLITKKAQSVPMLALPMLIPIILSFSSMDSYLWKDSILHEHSLVLVLMIVSTVWVNRFFMRVRLNEVEEGRVVLAGFSNVAGFVSAFYGIVYIWLASHALFTDDAGTIVALFVYIGVGSQLYLSGKKMGIRWKRIVGATLIGITSAYLLLVAGMILGTFGRIVAYMVIGVVLVSVAWHERNVSKLQGLREGKE